MLLGEDGAAAGAPDGTLFIDMLDDRARPTRAGSARRCASQGHGVRRRPGDRLGPEGRGRHADDHVRRQRRGHASARCRCSRRWARRSSHAGEVGQGQAVKVISQLGQRDQLRHARAGARGRPPRRRRPRGAARGDGRRLGELDDARSSRAGRCSSTTSRRCSSSSTCSRTSGCASTRRARPAPPFPFAGAGRRALRRGRRARPRRAGLRRRARGRRGPRRHARLSIALETRVEPFSGIGPIRTKCLICREIMRFRDFVHSM